MPAPVSLRYRLSQCENAIDELARDVPNSLRDQARLRKLRRQADMLAKLIAHYAAGTELEVDPALVDLPLLDIAREVAQSYDRYRVVKADLQAAYADLTGLTAWRGEWGNHVYVMLDVDHITASGYDLERIWAHELSHTIDYLDTRVGMRNGRRRDIDRRENFADALAGWLLETPPPSTLAEVRSWVPTLRTRLRSGEIRFERTDRLVPDPHRTNALLAAH